MECCHNDGNKQNNNASNLRYATKIENEGDKLKHGTRPMGEKINTCILKEKQVIEIRERYSAGDVSQRKLAFEYGVSPGTIHCIIKRKLWKQIA